MNFNIYSGNYYSLDRTLSEKNIKSVHKHPMFCGSHDISLFDSIENGNDFNENDLRQIYQFAFRACVFNYYEYTLKQVRESSNKGIEKRAMYGIMDNERERFKECYNSDNYDIFNTTVIKLDKEVNFISCSSINPYIDMKGKIRGSTNDRLYFINISRFEA